MTVIGCEAVLQPGMAELVYRSHGAQDVSFAGVIEEIHEAQGVCHRLAS